MLAGNSISLNEEPKKEPLDEFPPMPAGNKISNESDANRKEPKEEPLVLFHPYSLDNEADDNVYKKEEMSDHGEFPFSLDAYSFEIDHPYSINSSEDTDGATLEARGKKRRQIAVKTLKFPSMDGEVLKRSSSSRIVTRPVKYYDYVMDQPIEKPESHIEKMRRKEKTGDEELTQAFTNEVNDNVYREEEMSDNGKAQFYSVGDPSHPFPTHSSEDISSGHVVIEKGEKRKRQKTAKNPQVLPKSDEVLKRTSSNRIVTRPLKFADYVMHQPVVNVECPDYDDANEEPCNVMEIEIPEMVVAKGSSKRKTKYEV
ncbi:hypothetical protein PMAYCL1PPCAC_20831, partial [Pristionchus mayeri]